MRAETEALPAHTISTSSCFTTCDRGTPQRVSQFASHGKLDAGLALHTRSWHTRDSSALT
eukprot:2918398-Rhodomonas_salina.1